MECGCKIVGLQFCPKHAAADAMLTKLIEIKEELQDRYGIDDALWNGARNLIHELEALIAQAEPTSQPKEEVSDDLL